MNEGLFQVISKMTFFCVCVFLPVFLLLLGCCFFVVFLLSTSSRIVHIVIDEEIRRPTCTTIFLTTVRSYLYIYSTNQ